MSFAFHLRQMMSKIASLSTAAPLLKQKKKKRTPVNAISVTWFVLQVCMETQRFERLMEYFKNEDNNIDFMVCTHTQTRAHTHERLMAY